MRSEDLSTHSINSYFRWVKSFFSWLISSGYITESPAARIKIPKAKYIRKPFCSKEQVAQLIENAPDDDMRYVLYMGFKGGCRKMEIIEARPNWFD